MRLPDVLVDIATAGSGRSGRSGSSAFPRRVGRNAHDKSPVSESSEASFDDFAREHLRGLVRFAALLSGSATLAEDLVQEVLARMYPRWDELDARTTAMLAYVRRAIVNEHVSWRRRWSTRHIHLASDGVLPDVATPAPADTHDERLWRAVLSLPAQQRAAVVLRFYDDLDDDEIAAVLDCRPSSVRANISRGVAKLRAMTDDQRGGSDA